MRNLGAEAAQDPLTADLAVYVVGGAVRDALLNLPVSDRDWVVVGATPELLLARGFKAVGADFPVFLHPVSHEEYALARTERKSGPGYRGFDFHAAPGVTLEQDLARRDLTLNAIALSPEGRLIDPFGGWEDLNARLLRHVSPAFAEDPVRLLRLARFAARLPNFTVDPATLALGRALAAAGELNALVAERVWQELSRALMTDAPQRFFEVLDACHALDPILPGFTLSAALLSSLERAAAARLDVDSRWLLCLWDTWTADASQAAALQTALRAPRQCQRTAERLSVVLRYLAEMADGPAAESEQRLDFWLALDARRQPERAFGVLDAMQARLPNFPTEPLRTAFRCLNEIDTRAVITSLPQPDADSIRTALRSTYLAALRA